MTTLSTETLKCQESQRSHPDGGGMVVPREIDVLCGRGGMTRRHPGNQYYRQLVALHKPQYRTCRYAEKQNISKSIVATIRESDGHFLRKDHNTGMWYDIGDQNAVFKTSQALRDVKKKKLAPSKAFETSDSATGAQEALLEQQLEREQNPTDESAATEPTTPTEDEAPVCHSESPHATTDKDFNDMQIVQYNPIDLMPPVDVSRNVSAELVRLSFDDSEENDGLEQQQQQGQSLHPLCDIDLAMGASTLGLLSGGSAFDADDLSSGEAKQLRDQFVALMAASPAASPKLGHFVKIGMEPPQMISTTTQDTVQSTISMTSPTTASSPSFSRRYGRKKVLEDTAKHQDLESGRTLNSEDGVFLNLFHAGKMRPQTTNTREQDGQAESDAENNNSSSMMESSWDVFGVICGRSISSEVLSGKEDDQTETQESIVSESTSKQISNVMTQIISTSDASLATVDVD